jgi:antirestriction protein
MLIYSNVSETLELPIRRRCTDIEHIHLPDVMVHTVFHSSKLQDELSTDNFSIEDIYSWGTHSVARTYQWDQLAEMISTMPEH